MTRKVKRQGFLILGIPLFLIFAGFTLDRITQQGFMSIFDGKTLNGWEGNPAFWRVENGSIVGEITPNTPLKNNTFLIWRNGMPSDFELTLEFRISKAGNGGINYRSKESKDVPFMMSGYQLDIDGANRYTGQNYEERGRTTLAYRGQKTVIKAHDSESGVQSKVKNGVWSGITVTGSSGEPEVLLQKIKNQDWNTCRIVAKGNRLQHYINDVLMSDVTDNDAAHSNSKGLLGMQVHVGPPMKVEYRKIMIKQ